MFRKSKLFIHSILSVVIKMFVGTGVGKLPLVMRIYKILLKFSRPDSVVIQGKKIFLDKGDSLGLSILGVNDETLTGFIKSEIKSGKNVVDIGAHIGYFTLIFSDCVGNKGSVVAFEPSKDNFRIIKKNVQYNKCKNIQLENLAVSNVDGKVMLALSEDSQTNKISNDTTKNGYFIKSVSLNKYIGKRKTKIDYVKIDVEGAEFKVLQGMIKILKLNKNINLILEFCPKQLREFDSPPEELLTFLEKNGFHFYDINNREKNIVGKTKTRLLQEYSNGSLVANLFCTRKRNYKIPRL